MLDKVKQEMEKYKNKLKDKAESEAGKFSGPDKAKIKALSKEEYKKEASEITTFKEDDTVWVQLNPNKVVLNDGVSYAGGNGEKANNKAVAYHDTGERRIPLGSYSMHNARELTIELLFDTYTNMKIEADKEDVKTERIDKFVKKLITNSGVDQGPPFVFFSWGSIQFKGVITKMNTTYTLFTSKGVPVRATMNLTIKELYFS